MANIVPNIAKGRVTELYSRVKNNDPANSVLVIVAISVTGDQDAAMVDADTLQALLALANVAEVTNVNYARKVLNQDDLAAYTPDDTNNRSDLDLPDQTFEAIASGDAWTDLVICYDPDSTGGDDSALIPLSIHDFSATPDGSDIVAVISTFFRAS